jgi:hypothetical protein
LELTDRDGEGFPYLCEKLETRHLILAALETEDPQAGAVVQSGVLVGRRAGELHDLDVDLDGIPRASLSTDHRAYLDVPFLSEYFTRAKQGQLVA